MRGLHWHAITEPPLDSEAIAASLEAAYPGKLIRADEPWGTELTVIRLVYQFVVEFRIGERPGQVSLIHRATSKPDARAHSRATLERVLEELLETTR
jgi:hypothetical protein